MGDDGLDIVDGTVRVSQHVLDMCGGVEVRICAEASCLQYTCVCAHMYALVRVHCSG